MMFGSTSDVGGMIASGLAWVRHMSGWAGQVTMSVTKGAYLRSNLTVQHFCCHVVVLCVLKLLQVLVHFLGVGRWVVRDSGYRHEFEGLLQGLEPACNTLAVVFVSFAFQIPTHLAVG